VSLASHSPAMERLDVWLKRSVIAASVAAVLE
jgi:hypothetical protein